MPGPSPLITNYASIGSSTSKVEVGGLGVTYDGDTKKATITGVDTDQPISITAYVNVITSANVTILISNITGGYTSSMGNNSDGSYTITRTGSPSSSTVVVTFPSIGNFSYYLVAYQVTQ